MMTNLLLFADNSEEVERWTATEENENVYRNQARYAAKKVGLVARKVDIGGFEPKAA
jgi:hypothetical protein